MSIVIRSSRLSPTQLIDREYHRQPACSGFSENRQGSQPAQTRKSFFFPFQGREGKSQGTTTKAGHFFRKSRTTRHHVSTVVIEHEGEAKREKAQEIHDRDLLLLLPLRQLDYSPHSLLPALLSLFERRSPLLYHFFDYSVLSLLIHTIPHTDRDNQLLVSHTHFLFV